jgi:hypothetical protein
MQTITYLKVVERIVRLIIGWGVVGLFVAQILVALPWFVSSLAPLVENPNRSYDEKMRIKWGDYYDLVQFIQKETPNNAVLLIDSNSHINIDLYFLYPRQLYYGDKQDLVQHPIEYVILTGELPAPAVEGERMMLDDKRGLIRVRR